jgi:cytochrome c biogenesis protein CcmG/thiol:disulfide interchange protein DsbE
MRYEQILLEARRMINMTGRFLTLGVALLAVVAVASYPPYVKKHLYANVDLRGHRMPKLQVTQWLKGGSPSMKGKTLLIDMWATWCPSCRVLIPEMNKWSQKFKNKLVVIGVSDEDPAKVREFMTMMPMNYHVAVDSKQRLEKQLGVEGIPHVLVVSPDGIVRWQGFPGSEEDRLDDKKLAAIIARGR